MLVNVGYYNREVILAWSLHSSSVILYVCHAIALR